jgi:hypothetical protein
LEEDSAVVPNGEIAKWQAENVGKNVNEVAKSVFLD